MRVRREDGGHALRTVLRSMANDPYVLARVASVWKPAGLFGSKSADVIAGLCVAHFREYGSPPGPSLENLLLDWSDKRSDDPAVGQVDRLASAVLEDTSEPEGSHYCLDLAEKLINRTRLREVINAAGDALDRGDDEEAQRRLFGQRPVNVSGQSYIEVMNDSESLRFAFEEGQQPIVRYNGALGEFFGGDFARGCFVSFMGSAKRGKSFWVLDVAYRSVTRHRKRTAWFQVGDMTQDQAIRRFAVRAALHPLGACKLEIPTSFDRPDDDHDPVLKTDAREYKEGLTWRKAWKSFRKIQWGRKNERFRLSAHSSGSISVAEIATMLEQWAHDGWVADVICIDYADLLGPMPGVGRDAGRDGINESWKALRRLSQDLDSLVVTATQADAGSYESGLLRRKNFADDRRKYDHVTTMIGINETPDEKNEGRQRLNILARRNGNYSETQVVHVAGCMALAAPAMRSCW